MSLSLNDVRRLLVIKPSSLGDIVHALPAVAALRCWSPTATITWLVKPEWREILEGNPDIDEVITLPASRWSWLQTVRLLRSKRFDLVVDLQGLFRSGLIAWLTGAPLRVGFAAAREGSTLFYTHRVPLPVAQAPWRLLDMHAVDRNLMVAAHLGADIRHVRFHLPSLASDEKEIEAWLQEAGVQQSDRLIAIAPVDRLGIRSWPLDRFVSVAATLSQLPNVRIVLIGAPTERWAVEKFWQPVGNKLLDLVGKTRIRQLGVLLRRMRLLIVNDSAPMHIAAAVGTPVLGLFGPSSPSHHGPLGDGHVVLRTDIPCSPCGRSICINPNHLECLTSITVEDVVKKANEMLGGSKATTLISR